MSAQGRETVCCGRRQLPGNQDHQQGGKWSFPPTVRICADFWMLSGRVPQGDHMHDTPNRQTVRQRLATSAGPRAWLRPRREKVFQNHETRVPLDREAKVRIMHFARCLKHRTEKGIALRRADRQVCRCAAGHGLADP
jgi:hypothetical protein